ncbi:type II toxin-antitoxin system death-on-curing family toxin [Candidatus Mycolicibacterium alkanivorans]|uniref:Type II toxin-antitoxin system death-on-curing family toxin n=1 Tax=Candidatus Mycolicibacterium alkanivorans TaxID=2954114 RepID=A0ABS9YYB4_9MYCO|nr:type II toxin-antitoxin system death-on-curing family toxin [Candidatus Mycolicibacterium alkanivorans]MCI4676226.1 type II toxin-antitoxin system death-on-curing family toxin [Candidatus Mycolicibacterium alkanivorans]
MTVYLERDDIVAGGGIACGFPLLVTDEGLLQSAVARPQTSAFGDDAYPTLRDKAAALLHSLARNHAFVDGNKRTAWASAWAFLRLNGVDLPDVYDVDHAEQLVLTAALGEIDWPKIAGGLQALAAD